MVARYCPTVLGGGGDENCELTSAESSSLKLCRVQAIWAKPTTKSGGCSKIIKITFFQLN